LNSHHLAERLPPGSLLEAAGACGIQNTPPGSANVALNARVAGLSLHEIDQVLTTGKSLLQAWSLRGAPYVFPACDAKVFTLGLLPASEESLRAFIPGVEIALEKVGISATKVIDLMGDGIREILDERMMTKDELGIELARWFLPHLTAAQRAAWQSPSWYAPGQTLGESVARFALPVLSLQGLCCHAIRREGKAYLARTDQWLGPVPTDSDGNQARAELVRRYLRCFGPSTVQHFADWAGIALAQAAGAWKLVEADLIEIDDNGNKTWLHQEDLEGFQNPAHVEGIRFLPPHDPYLSLRDREKLDSDKSMQRQIWKHAGNPGVLLVDGNIAGLWRQRKKGSHLTVMIEHAAALSPAVRSHVEVEAAALARINDCTELQVDFRNGDDLLG
jgi:hypothetical protein